jgi:hypothetical protein
MAKKSRNIGAEILEGMREINRGEHGRVINVPDVAKTRAKTGLSQARLNCLACRYAPCKTGSKVGARLPAPPGLCS